MKILVLDNYDSFTFNLVHLIEKCSDCTIDVFKNNQIKLEDVNKYDKIILSPGPGLPKDAGIMPELLKKYAATKSILGVCLGMQAIGECFGAKLENLQNVMHGIQTPIKIKKNSGLFKNCPATLKVGRYHSWVISNNNFPAQLEVTAIDEQNFIMAIQHKTLKVSGVQFHPESILSDQGELIIQNWISDI